MVPGRWCGLLFLLDCFICEAVCSSCCSRLTTEATLSYHLWSECMSKWMDSMELQWQRLISEAIQAEAGFWAPRKACSHKGTDFSGLSLPGPACSSFCPQFPAWLWTLSISFPCSSEGQWEKANVTKCAPKVPGSLNSPIAVDPQPWARHGLSQEAPCGPAGAVLSKARI